MTVARHPESVEPHRGALTHFSVSMLTMCSRVMFRNWAADTEEPGPTLACRVAACHVRFNASTPWARGGGGQQRTVTRSSREGGTCYQ